MFFVFGLLAEAKNHVLGVGGSRDVCMEHTHTRALLMVSNPDFSLSQQCGCQTWQRSGVCYLCCCLKVQDAERLPQADVIPHWELKGTLLTNLAAAAAAAAEAAANSSSSSEQQQQQQMREALL
jgi:hypothetical protein